MRKGVNFDSINYLMNTPMKFKFQSHVHMYEPIPIGLSSGEEEKKEHEVATGSGCVASC